MSEREKQRERERDSDEEEVRRVGEGTEEGHAVRPPSPLPPLSQLSSGAPTVTDCTGGKTNEKKPQGTNEFTHQRHTLVPQASE